jgi:hypothetical protein
MKEASMAYKLGKRSLAFSVVLSLVGLLLFGVVIPAKQASAAGPVVSVSGSSAYPNASTVQGTVASVNNVFLTVTPIGNGMQMSFTLGGEVVIELHGATALAGGQAVTVSYNRQTMTASRVVANAPANPPAAGVSPMTVQGTLLSVSGNVATVTKTSIGSQVTLTLDANTVVELHGAISLDAGQTVTAVYNGQTMVAERITAQPTVPVVSIPSFYFPFDWPYSRYYYDRYPRHHFPPGPFNPPYPYYPPTPPAPPYPYPYIPTP